MTLFHHFGIVAASGGVAAAPGMVLINPTSIAYSGTSASVGANGQVTFSAVSSLSLNGVFSADFDNYVVAVRELPSTAVNTYVRLRASGTDASGSDYTYQYLFAASTSIGAARSNSTQALVGNPSGNGGSVFYFYGSALAQPTALRSVTISGGSGAILYDVANTHSLSTAYDGFSFYPNTGSITGALQVYGVRS